MTRRRTTTIASLGLAACLCSRGATADPAPSAVKHRLGMVVFQAAQGHELAGGAVFVQSADKLEMFVNIGGLDPGKHGFHVHQTGDCTGPDFKSAGPHFNPQGHNHGAPGAAQHHAGDVGNIVAGADGKGSAQLTLAGVTLEPGHETSIAGRALIVHSNADDLVSQPSGAAGPLIACGVIEVLAPEQKVSSATR